VWLVCDGPVDQSGQQTVVFGARGDTHLEITVFGAIRGLHSGHYGNWAPNPAMMLAQLLAGMKDQEGNVLIPHFYDGISPLGTVEKQAIAEASVNDDALRQELDLGHVDGGGRKLLELLNLPSLNINGLAAANVGKHWVAPRPFHTLEMCSFSNPSYIRNLIMALWLIGSCLRSSCFQHFAEPQPSS
jgi:acetylornithine deacetylase/succinyl-diaminopimelate desuccinylase-like protein